MKIEIQHIEGTDLALALVNAYTDFENRSTVRGRVTCADLYAFNAYDQALGDAHNRAEHLTRIAALGALEFNHQPDRRVAWVVSWAAMGDGVTITLALMDDRFAAYYDLFAALLNSHLPDRGEGQPTHVDPADALLNELATRTIDRSGNLLTHTYTTGERLAIVRLWSQWKTERGAAWTRERHARHFRITTGTLGKWITEYAR